MKHKAFLADSVSFYKKQEEPLSIVNIENGSSCFCYQSLFPWHISHYTADNICPSEQSVRHEILSQLHAPAPEP